MKTIYFDENMSEYWAEALDLLSKKDFMDVCVKSTKFVFGIGAADEEIIPKIGNEGGILITKDLNIHRTRLQAQLCEEHKVGVFFLKMPKGQDKQWEIVKLLVYNWEDIVSKTNKEKRPFSFRFKPNGKPERM